MSAALTCAELATVDAIVSESRALVVIDKAPNLAAVAAEINHHLTLLFKNEVNAGRHRLRAGQALIEARKHVPPGEWIAWCKANIKRGQRDIQRLMRIAGADDPDAALERERAGNRVSKALSRANATVSRIVTDTAPKAKHVIDRWTELHRKLNERMEPEPVRAEISPEDRALQEQWEMSLSNHAGEAIALEAFWNRLFGDWRQFESSSTLVALARQAAEAWTNLADEMMEPVEAHLDPPAPVDASDESARRPPKLFAEIMPTINSWSDADARAESVQVVSRAGSSAGSYPHALK